jgi:hypothetical protein
LFSRRESRGRLQRATPETITYGVFEEPWIITFRSSIFTLHVEAFSYVMTDRQTDRQEVLRSDLIQTSP